MLQKVPGPISPENAAVIYYIFAREAELWDQHAVAPAAAWQTLGKVICALVTSNGISNFEDNSFSIAQRFERISRNLDLLDDVTRIGGSSSANIVRWLATALSMDFGGLRDELCGVRAGVQAKGCALHRFLKLVAEL